MYTKDRKLQLNIRLNAMEYAWLRDRSRTLNTNISDYIRRLAQRDRIAYHEAQAAKDRTDS